MDFFEVVTSRRSVRKYTAKTVPDEVIQKALATAVVAPTSSNLQAWEFYWVKSADKKSKLIDACLFQATAKTANHLIVAVSRIDTWKRNRNLILEQMKKSGSLPKMIKDYYFKVIPFLYTHDPIGIFASIKWLVLNVIGLFRPIARRPVTRKDLFEVVTKSTALACENFMLAITAQGYGTCPMEGFDESRVKKILGLGCKASVTMIISVGDIDPSGIYGPQLRVDPKLVIHEV
jgi:nitroreductase